MTTYPILPDLTPNGQLYWNERQGYAEALLPNGGHRSSHAPCLLELPDGTLLCAWFAGTFEGDADVHIIGSRLPKGATRWEQPHPISRDPQRSEQNPSLFLAPNSEVWAMYTAQLGRQEGKDNMQFTAVIRRQRSTDGGRTWQKPEVVFPREGSFCRQPIQILSNGRWIFSNWLCTDSPDGLTGDPTVFQLSDDQGKTWRQVDMPQSRGRVHANVVELEPGHLAAFMRSRQADFIYRSESLDNGDSWSVPIPTPLPNNNSSISALKLQSGRLAIAYNPTHILQNNLDRAAWPGLRCPVAVALSEDGGLTFPLIRNLELGEGYVGTENRSNNRQYEYPYLLQSREGKLHLVYASRNRIGIQYIQFTEADIMGKKRGNSVYNPTAAQV